MRYREYLRCGGFRNVLSIHEELKSYLQQLVLEQVLFENGVLTLCLFPCFHGIRQEL